MDKKLTVTIINDCRDSNASGRQIVRVSSLFDAHICFVGVSNDIEAAGNIIDILDASGETENIVLVNVAPRHGDAKKWENGTPFCYFTYKKIIVVSTFDGATLSLVKKLRLADSVHLIEQASSLEKMLNDKMITKEEKDHIEKTQFRSFDFLPRVAKLVYDEGEAPGSTESLEKISDMPKGSVWWIDNFGNCKTNLVKSDLKVSEYTKLATKFGELSFYERLKDVPDGEPAVIFGSSGIGDDRFVEIVVQGGSAQEKFNIKNGDSIF